MLKPHTHMLDVEVRIKRKAGIEAPPAEVLVMPVWTPGSYLIREFERHVQDFVAVDANGGGSAVGKDQQEFLARHDQRIARLARHLSGLRK